MKNQNSEPTLESIGDYETLQGSKRKVVWSVVIVGLIIGAMFAFLNSSYGTVDDKLQINDPIENVKLNK